MSIGLLVTSGVVGYLVKHPEFLLPEEVRDSLEVANFTAERKREFARMWTPMSPRLREKFRANSERFLEEHYGYRDYGGEAIGAAWFSLESLSLEAQP